MNDSQDLRIQTLQENYKSGRMKPRDLLLSLSRRIRSGGIHPVWIHIFSEQEIEAQLNELPAAFDTSLPLYGIPFAIKDNMDLGGHPTTAGCPAFAYIPMDTAPAVARLLAAGAILLGKTSMDQFATGTTGTRSPHGPCPSARNAAYVAGGSSSGSAVAVASNLASFSLGTDTAGSGRIPAAFNGIVGLKPTRGRVSIRGIVPACRSIDCVSVFANNVQDSKHVLKVIEGYDAAESYARHIQKPQRGIRTHLKGSVLGVPQPNQQEFFGCHRSADTFQNAVVQLRERGATVVEFDYEPFREVAQMIYKGPWMAERYASLKTFFNEHPDEIFPITYQAIAGSTRFSAADAFEAQHRLADLMRIIEPLWGDVDAIVTPTTPRAYSIAEVCDKPIEFNNNLGYYTNFVNLLDLCAISIPAEIDGTEFPFGVMLAAPAWNDNGICSLAADWYDSRSRNSIEE